MAQPAIQPAEGDNKSTIGRTIGAGQFKAICLRILDEVEQTRETVVITKHGKPVAQLTPMPAKQPLFGAMKDSVLWEGDIVSPLEDEWEANR
jgi:prevent-host-death family protein